MEVTETKSDGLRREFKVVVPAADIEERLNSRLKELSHQVSMPGFRPGKVPLSVLRKRYGPSVMGEVLERAVSESSNAAISEHSIRPAGQPHIEVTSFDEGSDLEYTLAVDVLPKFEPMDFGELKLEQWKAEVTDEAVDEALENLASRHERFGDPVDRPARTGDQILIDFEGKLAGVAFEGGSAKDWRTVLGKSGFVQGFEENLIGRKAGEEVTFDLHFPEDYGNKDMAGKDTVFTVKIKEIRESVEIPVDDQLAKDMGLDDLAALRKMVREQLEREYAAVSRSRLKRTLLDRLAAAHDFEVPEGLVENEFQAIWTQYHADEGHAHDHDHGHDHDHAHEGGEKGADDAELEQERKECREVAERRVRLGLLLGEVGRRNNIQVTPEELSRAVMAEASRYPGQEKQVVDYIRQTPQALAAIRAPLFEDKVVDFILEIAKVAERKVSPEELMKDPDEPISSDSEPESKGRKKAGKKG